MKTLDSLISFAGARACLHLAAVASLAVGLIVPSAYAHTEADPFITDLIVGGGNPASAIDVGDVLVWNDGEQLIVQYHVTAQDWCLTETHVHIATSADAIPQTRTGNAIPGKFDFSATLDCVTSYTMTVPLMWGTGVELSIAAHASVKNPTVVYIDGPWEETAWGAGFDFPGRNWAMYFTYTLQEEPTASLGDFVWEDLNRNGIQDAGEPGLFGVEVQLFDSPQGNLLATTITDADGLYQFSGLTPGDYVARFVQPAGLLFTVPNQGADDTKDSDADTSTGETSLISLAAGEINLNTDAGLFEPHEGCTAGFWRNHVDTWPATGFSPMDDFDTTFGVDMFAPDITLEDALFLPGGGNNYLARQGTAALLNAAHPDISYPLTTAEIIAFVQGGGDANILDSHNNLGCPLD